MSIFKILREQSAIEFNGRLTIQNNHNGQYLGAILIQGGALVACSYKKQKHRKGLINLLMEDFKNIENLNYIVEPELIDESELQFKIEIVELEREFSKLYEEVEKNKKLRPPDSLILAINPDFICRGEEINSLEFDLLCTLKDHPKVSLIYEKSDYYEFEVTSGLISLRKKGALKVFK